MQRGDYVSIRHLDNWLLLTLVEPPEACNMCGKCNIPFVIEGDGSIYPCDFYVYDKWRLGTLGEQCFAECALCETAKRFLADAAPVPEKCQKCQ